MAKHTSTEESTTSRQPSTGPDEQRPSSPSSSSQQQEQQQQQPLAASSSSSNLSPASPGTSRSPSPGFPSPSSTFIPPPSEEDEIARMKSLDIPSRAESARRTRSLNSVGGGDDADDSQVGDDQGSSDQEVVVTPSETEAVGGSSHLSPRTADPEPADDQDPLSSVPDGGDDSAYPLSSTPNPSTGEAFARAAASSLPRQPSPSSSRSSDARGIQREPPRHHHHHQHHQHQHHHGIQSSVGPPESRPALLGSAETHSPGHPGTIMYPQPDDDDVRPQPGDRSRPSEDRVQLMHEAIDQREKDYVAEQDERARKKTSDQAEQAELERMRPEGERPALPVVVVRDFAFPKGDERFAGQGPLRASLFLAHEDEQPSSSGGIGSSWGFGGWKTDSPVGEREDEDEDEEEEWQDDEEGREDDFDLDDHAGDGEEEQVEQGVYKALYAFHAEADSELTLKEADLVRVHRSGGVGWVVATLLSPTAEPLKGPAAEGLVPRGYLQFLHA